MVLGGQHSGRVDAAEFFERPPRAGVRVSDESRRGASGRGARAASVDRGRRPAIVAACNDPEIPRWIPVIPQPYTEADGLAFVRGEVRPALDYSFAVTEDGDVVGAIGMTTNRNDTGHITATGARRALAGGGDDARAADSGAVELRGARARSARADHRSRQRRVSARGRRSASVAKGFSARTLCTPDGRRRDSVMFSLLPGELAE